MAGVDGVAECRAPGVGGLVGGRGPVVGRALFCQPHGCLRLGAGLCQPWAGVVVARWLGAIGGAALCLVCGDWLVYRFPRCAPRHQPGDRCLAAAPSQLVSHGARPLCYLGGALALYQPLADLQPGRAPEPFNPDPDRRVALYSVELSALYSTLHRAILGRAAFADAFRPDDG